MNGYDRSTAERNYGEGLRNSGNGAGHRRSREKREFKVEAPCFSLVVLVCRNRNYAVDIC